jgi:hypothetical protein
VAVVVVVVVVCSDTQRAVFVCGEIDCREGIGGALQKGVYPKYARELASPSVSSFRGDEREVCRCSLETAVIETVSVYAAGIRRLSLQYGIVFLIHPVPPPCDAARTRARSLLPFFALLSRLLGERERCRDGAGTDGATVQCAATSAVR